MTSAASPADFPEASIARRTGGRGGGGTERDRDVWAWETTKRLRMQAVDRGRVQVAGVVDAARGMWSNEPVIAVSA